MVEQCRDLPRQYLPVAILVFPGVGLIDRNTAVAAIRKENAEGRAWDEVHFDDVITKWITVGSVALLAYVATARWNYEETAFQTYCTTIYVRKDESWKVALHQQTRV